MVKIYLEIITSSFVIALVIIIIMFLFKYKDIVLFFCKKCKNLKKFNNLPLKIDIYDKI